MGHEFRFVYMTGLYDETVAFLRDSLGLRVLESWEALDEDDHRGTAFAAGPGLIEVMEKVALERGPSDTASGGPFAAIEVEDVDALHERVTSRGVPLHYALADKPWGHRGFSVRDPNGVEFAFYGRIGAR
jgi:catechol 2,3-dioxygenase-like lactoylglutathione lyase family enzyme